MGKGREPLFSVSFCDRPTGVRGYLVVDSLIEGLASGGIRIHEQITHEELAELARNMTRKQAAVGIATGGAKSGLAMDPTRPDKADIIRRFFRVLRPLFQDCYNCGPDLNTTIDELEEIAKDVGIPCVKIAVGRQRGLSDEEFLKRYALFQSATPIGTVHDLRAPMAVFTSVKCCAETLGIPKDQVRVAVQGAGKMGAGTARLAHDAGMKVIAWADDKRCYIDVDGLDVPSLHAKRTFGRLPETAQDSYGREKILDVPCDVLVLAAVSDAVSPEKATELDCKAIAVAANMGLARPVEQELTNRGILISPDIIASEGGSLAVESLYRTHPKVGQDVLNHVSARVEEVLRPLLQESRRGGGLTRDLLVKRRLAQEPELAQVFDVVR